MEAVVKIKAVVETALDPEWTLPSRVGDNPLAWLIQVNGVPVASLV